MSKGINRITGLVPLNVENKSGSAPEVTRFACCSPNKFLRHAEQTFFPSMAPIYFSLYHPVASPRIVSSLVLGLYQVADAKKHLSQ